MILGLELWQFLIYIIIFTTGWVLIRWDSKPGTGLRVFLGVILIVISINYFKIAEKENEEKEKTTTTYHTYIGNEAAEEGCSYSSNKGYNVCLGTETCCKENDSKTAR